MADRVTRPLLVVAAIVLALTPARAQLHRLGDGERVRITAPSRSAAPVVGHFVRRTTDSLVVRDMIGGVYVAFPRAAIEKLERSNGARKCSGVKAGLIGGVVLGTAAFLSDPETTGPLVALPAALLGYAVSSFVARQRTCERWTTIPVPYA